MSVISVFTNIPTAPPKQESKILDDFRRDTHPEKVNLAGREYLNEDGQTTVLPLIWKIKQQIGSDPTLTPGYPPPLGLTELTKRVVELTLGKDSPAIVENRVLGVQAVGFMGAVRLGAELLRRWCNNRASWSGPILLPSPCDDSLAETFEAAGFGNVCYYRYWDANSLGVCAENVLKDLEEAPEQSVVVLSVSGHYPTGADLSVDDWKLVADVMMQRRLFPFFLMSEQGFSKSFEKDAWPVRHCVSLGLEVMCTQSFCHTFGLYGEQVGHLLCVLKHNSFLLAVQSQLEKSVQTLWSSPPTGGARVVATVLSNPAHLIEWQEGVRSQVERCMLIREQLREKLRLLGCPGQWDHLTKQTGLYCCTGLSGHQVEFLGKRRHVYLLDIGCLNISAINSRNVDYVAESIHLAVTTL
ncbi:putative aspartate aminotransferase, cytoplasmic 2 [Alosa pseudoharengus]|uniref:putative aspartate aminotransferase, cytoplasmic 2 n=1 Tax=Alosa pseudoharengus TaxID=34774 RepID=UPI003F88FA35